MKSKSRMGYFNGHDYFCKRCDTIIQTDSKGVRFCQYGTHSQNQDGKMVKKNLVKLKKYLFKVKALKYIEKLCLVYENGDKKNVNRVQKIMDNIYKYAHCVQESHSCYDTHKNWRKELNNQNWEI